MSEKEVFKPCEYCQCHESTEELHKEIDTLRADNEKLKAVIDDDRMEKRMSEHEKFRTNCGTSYSGTHWPGCDCHENNWKKKLDDLWASLKVAKEALEVAIDSLEGRGLNADHLHIALSEISRLEQGEKKEGEK